MSITVGRITFDDDGYTDNPKMVEEVHCGERIMGRKDGSWYYEFWSYADHIIGLQWNGPSYIGMWIAGEVVA